jgi:hypothetical protein
VLAGDAMLADMDDFIDAWHESADDMPLHEFLGLTEHEYALWVEQPDVLPFLLASKKYHHPVEELIDMSEAHLMAARSTAGGTSAHLVEWLHRTGRIS